jgi:hypothetical protein
MILDKDIGFSRRILKGLPRKSSPLRIVWMLKRLHHGGAGRQVFGTAPGRPLSQQDLCRSGRSVDRKGHVDAEHYRNRLIKTLIHHVHSANAK